MPSFKKVHAESRETLSEEIKKNEKDYKDKVEDLKKRCQKFSTFLHDSFNSDDSSSANSGPASWSKGFKKIFGEDPKAPMKAKIITSRTSRVLHDIYKKLSKIKDKTFNVDNIAKVYVKAFKFKPKKIENIKGVDYVKRSAIDNPAIVNYFMNETTGYKINSVEKNIPELFEERKNLMGSKNQRQGFCMDILSQNQKIRSKSKSK